MTDLIASLGLSADLSLAIQILILGWGGIFHRHVRSST